MKTGDLIVASNDSDGRLGQALADVLSCRHIHLNSRRFGSTGELSIHLSSAIGRCCAVILSTPATGTDRDLVEHLFAVRTVREAGADVVISVLPYLPYSRSDRRYHPLGPTACVLVLDLMAAAGCDTLVTIDPHGKSITRSRSLRVVPVDVTSLLLAAVRSRCGPGAVLVAPDQGAFAKVAEAARLCSMQAVYLSKTRVGDRQVRIDGAQIPEGLTHAVLLDDAIYSAATTGTAAHALRREGVSRIDVAATHFMPSSDTVRTLVEAGVTRLVTSNSLLPRFTTLLDGGPASRGITIEIVDVVPALARAVKLCRDEFGRP